MKYLLSREEIPGLCAGGDEDTVIYIQVLGRDHGFEKHSGNHIEELLQCISQLIHI